MQHKNLNLKYYQLTAILSVIFAVVGFSYNVWRLEETERNSNIRTACFELSKELGDLQLIIYSLYYDKNEVLGSPRRGWVKIALIKELSSITTPMINQKFMNFEKVWQTHANEYGENEEAVFQIIAAIDLLRDQIRLELANLH